MTYTPPDNAGARQPGAQGSPQLPPAGPSGWPAAAQSVEPQSWQDPRLQAPSQSTPPVVEPTGFGPAPQQPRRRRGGLIALFVGLGVLVIGVIAVVITVTTINNDRDPAETVAEYLRAIERGDAERAAKTGGSGSADTDFLTDEVLSSAVELPRVKRVVTLDRSNAGATVEATLSLADETFTRTFHVEPGPKELLVLNTWKLDDPLTAKAEITADGFATARLGKTPVELGDESERAVTLYPGVYEVGVDAGDYFDAPTVRITALPGETASAAIEAVPNERFEAEVLKQVGDRVKQCTEVPSNMDPECPTITKNRKLESLRAVTIPSGFDSIDADSFTSSAGEIAVIDVDSTTERFSRFEVSGTIRLEDGAPQVSQLSSDSYGLFY